MKTASVMGAPPSPVMSRAPSNTLTAVACCASAVPSANQHIAKKIPIESRPAKKLAWRDLEFTRRIRISSFKWDCACQRTLTRFGSRRWCAQDLFFARPDGRIIRPELKGSKAAFSEGTIRQSWRSPEEESHQRSPKSLSTGIYQALEGCRSTLRTARNLRAIFRGLLES